MEIYVLTIYDENTEVIEKIKCNGFEELKKTLIEKNPVAYLFDKYIDGVYDCSADWNLTCNWKVRNKKIRFEKIARKLKWL